MAWLPEIIDGYQWFSMVTPETVHGYQWFLWLSWLSVVISSNQWLPETVDGY